MVHNAEQNDDPGKLNFIEKVNFIYKLLGVLDSKSSALLRYNGILIAILSIILFRSTVSSPPTNIFEISLAALAFSTLFVSAILCLLVVRLYWLDSEGFGQLTNDILSEQESQSLSRDKSLLDKSLSTGIKIVEGRTRLYWWAWRLSFVGTIIFAIIVIMRILQLI